MYNLIRFFNQNRRKIIIIILFIVFLLGIIQLLNYFAKKENTANNSKNESITENVAIKNEVVSSKSAISGANVSTKNLKRDTEVISKFVEYCNSKNVDGAYSLLTEECKEVMFPSIEDFNRVYYTHIFNNQTRSYTVENWIGNTYKVEYSNDILSTGKIDNDMGLLDYMTVVKSGEIYKLNINNYVGRSIPSKTTEIKDIAVTINSIDSYMDYEIYNLSVENKSDNTILLDTSDSTKSVYLQDTNDTKYYFYNNEVIQNRLKVQSKLKNTIEIKFMNPYTSGRTIKKLVFSNLVLNYDEYKQMEDKAQYNFMVFNVNV